MNEQRMTDAQHRIEDLYARTNGKCYVSFSGGKDSTVLLALIKQCQELGTVGDIPAVFSNTGIELGVTVEFINWVKENWYPNVVMIRPEKSFEWVLREKGKPIRSKAKSEFLNRYRRNPTENTMRCLIAGVSKEGKPAIRTRLADRDMHMVHSGFGIQASSACCDFLKKKPMSGYEKSHGMNGCLTGIRMDEGGHQESACSGQAKGRRPVHYAEGRDALQVPCHRLDRRGCRCIRKRVRCTVVKGLH